MKIVEMLSGHASFKNIPVSECFRTEQDDVYFKIKKTGTANAVRVLDGSPNWFDPDLMVERLDTELVIR